jgi:hypothetical protein
MQENFAMLCRCMKPYLERILKLLCNSHLYVLCVCLLISCHLLNNGGKELSLNPAQNNVYKYSFFKASRTEWPYNGDAHTKYDTVHLDFSMKMIGDSNNATTFGVIYHKFKWNNEVNYVRDSSHAKPFFVILTDSGTVESVMNTDALLQDIRQDISTKKYVYGILPDYISERGVQDMFNKVFGVLPARRVKQNDTWLHNQVMIAKAPVQLSNLFVLEHLNSDTAIIQIQSFISARQSAGDITFLKGNKSGYVSVSSITGMPFLFETQSDIITSANEYDIKESEHTLVKQVFH